MPSSKNAVILVVISFLLVFMVYSSIAQFYSVSAKPPRRNFTCSTYPVVPPRGGAISGQSCCQYINGKAVYCTSCEYDANGNQVGDCKSWTPQQTPDGNTIVPPSLGTVFPPSNNTGGITNGKQAYPAV